MNWNPAVRLQRRLLHLVAVVVCFASAWAEDMPQFGPAWHAFPLTLGVGERTEALGPFWVNEKGTNYQLRAVPPFWARYEQPGLEVVSTDILFPIISLDRFGTESYSHFFDLLTFAHANDQRGDQTKRFTIFPFYFQQKSADTNRNYRALFPFYGHLQNRLSRDEIAFVAWPMYARTKKKGVTTRNYLVPIVHQREGPGLRGWQVWPFVGNERKEITWSTNGFGDVKLVGGHEQFFLAWPIYFKDKTGIGTTNPVTQNVVFPFASVLRSPARDSATYPCLIGYTVTEDREKGYKEYGFPWPLMVSASGPGKTGTRIFPIYSSFTTPTQESRFWLWPFYKYFRTHSVPLDLERTRIFFFVYSDTTQKNTVTGKVTRRTDFWPLFTARRDPDGSERFQMLALLEPYAPYSRGFERGWSPLWSIWRSERNATTGAASQSFLWNLYRRETTPNSKKFSLLFGLFQYQSGTPRPGWRLFYVPLGGGKASQGDGEKTRNARNE